jgi:phospholipase/carboxylesterase
MEYITLLQYVVIHKKILLSAGINDPIVSRTETENLYRLFQKTNANITLKYPLTKSQFNSRRYIDCKKMDIK